MRHLTQNGSQQVQFFAQEFLQPILQVLHLSIVQRLIKFCSIYRLSINFIVPTLALQHSFVLEQFDPKKTVWPPVQARTRLVNILGNSNITMFKLFLLGLIYQLPACLPKYSSGKKISFFIQVGEHKFLSPLETKIDILEI